MISVGVVGVGSFGEKRSAAVKACKNAKLVCVSDKDPDRAALVAQRLGVQYGPFDELLSNKETQVVIICVPNKYHAPLAVAALKANKHVLCEKPLARNVEEAQLMVNTAREVGRTLKVGSNHRYFLSVRKAYDLVKSGAIGEVISFNGRIGNSGERIKDSWFWNKEISGGGTILDNGCHLLDIARWFMGDFVEATGMTTNLYWKNCPVEDTATGVFLKQDGRMATVNSSWRQLSGYFHFEINGNHGYITVDGRFDTHGGDHIYWQSIKDGGEIHAIDFGQMKPNSYMLELSDFFEDLEMGREPQPSGQDGLEVMKMIDAIYRSNENRKTEGKLASVLL